MKNILVILTGAMVMIALATTASGQYAGQMTVRVPFDFGIENEHLQPGDYIVEKVASGRLRIHTSDGRVSVTFLAIPKQDKTASEAAHFIFRRYGNRYFLAAIKTPGLETGWELLQGRAEQELEKNKSVPVETAVLVGR
jgi:hypothetical protein